MNLWEELDACKFEDNEYLVEHLIEVVKDEGINTLEELKTYEDNYFIESGMTKKDWIKWYEKSFDTMADLDKVYGEEAARKINSLKEELKKTEDINKKIENIIKICVALEREFCFLVEAYDLVLGGQVTGVVDTDVVSQPNKEDKIDIPNVTHVVPVNDDDDVKNQILIVPNELVEVDKNKNVVLCGSMRFKDHIIKISERLKAFGFNPLLPEECIRGEKKEIASRAHFDRISNPDNGIVLIVNVTKNGIPNYIGPSTFAEIAMGFYYRKKVVLLNDIYHPYDDELLGWNVVTLKGQLEKLRELYMQ